MSFGDGSCGCWLWFAYVAEKGTDGCWGSIAGKSVQCYVSTFIGSKGRTFKTCEVDEALGML